MAQEIMAHSDDEECQVCFVDLLEQTGEPHIFDCGEGHLLCQGCNDTVPESEDSGVRECPTCKIPLENQRNRSVERIRDKRLKKKMGLEKAHELLALQDPLPKRKSADEHGANMEESLKDARPSNIEAEGSASRDVQGAENVPLEPEEANVLEQLPEKGKKADKETKRKPFKAAESEGKDTRFEARTRRGARGHTLGGSPSTKTLQNFEQGRAGGAGGARKSHKRKMEDGGGGDMEARRAACAAAALRRFLTATESGGQAVLQAASSVGGEGREGARQEVSSTGCGSKGNGRQGQTAGASPRRQVAPSPQGSHKVPAAQRGRWAEKGSSQAGQKRKPSADAPVPSSSEIVAQSALFNAREIAGRFVTDFFREGRSSLGEMAQDTFTAAARVHAVLSGKADIVDAKTHGGLPEIVVTFRGNSRKEYQDRCISYTREQAAVIISEVLSRHRRGSTSSS